MTSVGKVLRLGQIFDQKTGTALIVPMDHPVEGYYEQLEDPRGIIDQLIEAGASAFLLRRGTARLVAPVLAGRAGLILRTTIATGLRGKAIEQVFVTTVEEAVRLGAAAVCPTVYLGGETEPVDLEYLGLMADQCEAWGMPLMSEVFPLGGDDLIEPGAGPYSLEDMQMCVRIAAEEGADFIKTWYSGDSASYQKVTRYSTVPIVIAGGPKVNTTREALEMVKGAMDAGCVGTSIGRNIWQHPDPAAMMRAMAKIVLAKASVDEAMLEFKH